MLQSKLSFKAIEGHKKYLGLPTYLGSSKKHIFSIIQDKVWKKLKRWKGGYLSQAGQEILIKSIAHAIPTYAMECFILPSSILKEIEKMCLNFFCSQRNNEHKTAWVAWEKLNFSKRDGGLGMRDLSVFNKAMLAKQVCRLLNKPNSLMSKTLKQKYFPNCELMEAKVNTNVSYTWRSLMSARGVIARGARKLVGNGNTVEIWKDPWVPNLPNFKALQRLHLPDDAPKLVAELFCNGEWDQDRLREHFSAWEVREILKIPVAHQGVEDGWTWHFTKNGEFSVRSASCLLEETTGPTTLTIPNKTTWSLLWYARVPPKIKHFGWRSLHNGLPVCYNLKRRGICSSDVCPVRGEFSESSAHALIFCIHAKNVWYLSPLRLAAERIISFLSLTGAILY
uniref:Reverse transcriptase zinc-binding domain-containing protein n=1 Tax=Chenopodium quinoa TaxID=63459 RepID=A0A803N1Y0_CHEQI